MKVESNIFGFFFFLFLVGKGGEGMGSHNTQKALSLAKFSPTPTEVIIDSAST